MLICFRTTHNTSFASIVVILIALVALTAWYDDNGETLSLLSRITKTNKHNASNASSLPLCTRPQIIGTGSQWVKQHSKSPPYIVTEDFLRCYPQREYYNNSWQHQYAWQPRDEQQSKCQFTPWSSKQFCSIAQGTTIAIIGDSLSWEMYASLVQLNGVETHLSFQHQSLKLGQNVVQTVCNKTMTRIMYRRDDHLTNITGAIRETFPQVLILNRGAHYAGDANLTRGIGHNIAEIKTWLAQCELLQIKCHFFWRTTVPGHPQCGNYTTLGPVNDLAAMERLVENRSNYDNITIQWRWYDYQHQNELVLAALNQSRIPFQVIDGYYLNMLRPDEHRVAHMNDCLHNCYPGKMDVYNQLLLHYLRMNKNNT